MTDTPTEIRRADYQSPTHAIDHVELDFELDPERTVVRSTLVMRRLGQEGAPLVLHGEDLETRSVAIDGVPLPASAYTEQAEQLTIHDPPDAFELAIEVVICPQGNTQLSGLYRSGGMYCTQCEAEGFRRITWFMDRPDVMTRFRVRIEADAVSCPVLLSNGNRVDQGPLPGDRHFAVWTDPFPKPSYLFALVAGDLGHVHDTFVTADGREVDLYVYSEHENTHRLDHALACLRSAMGWDERVFGLQYDLDIYNIVAVHHFNMGAMENKSLNVFNAARVLASPDTATDGDFEVIDGVIAHEYFHNWTGNRVTCRDWFQLTLKEGLTVFRDQQYSADMTSAAVKRIDDVLFLRALQFPEDAGPMAHPIRPDAYIAVDNFYTATVYDKGAEVIRMIHTLGGADGFRKGMDLYFERHDGRAVTCDDFRAAMADANELDLDQFERWYLQAGTPVVRADGRWDPAARTWTLTLTQTTAPTPRQPDKEPFHIPVACGLLGEDGRELSPTRLLQLRERRQDFVFTGIDEEPTPSLLRGFSAPVKLELDLDDGQLARLMAHDTDPFNRWEAGQRLYTRALLASADAVIQDEDPDLAEAVFDGFGQTLAATDIDRSLQARALRLPAERTLAQEMSVVRPGVLRRVRRHALRAIAERYSDELSAIYERNAPAGPYQYSPKEAGRRRLRNTCLGLLSTLSTDETTALCLDQFQAADNMTDQLSALVCLASLQGPAADEALAAFYERWQGVPLVVDKWLSVQASADRDDTAERVDELLAHEAFDLRNPNKVRSLVRVFARNQAAFHRLDGVGYAWIGDRILELDPLNPQIAARTAESFSDWRRYGSRRQQLMRAQLERLAAAEGLSRDLYEIVLKSLGD
jgi:aminopeptidase N